MPNYRLAALELGVKIQTHILEKEMGIMKKNELGNIDYKKKEEKKLTNNDFSSSSRNAAAFRAMALL